MSKLRLAGFGGAGSRQVDGRFPGRVREAVQCAGEVSQEREEVEHQVSRAGLRDRLQASQGGRGFGQDGRGPGHHRKPQERDRKSLEDG